VETYNGGFWRADEWHLFYQGEGGPEVFKRIRRRLVAKYGRVHDPDHVSLRMSSKPGTIWYGVYNQLHDYWDEWEVDCSPEPVEEDDPEARRMDAELARAMGGKRRARLAWRAWRKHADF
jgi:hypothetical protein